VSRNQKCSIKEPLQGRPFVWDKKVKVAASGLNSY